MSIITENATQAEKAAAWDRLMASSYDDTTAIEAAWEWLAHTVRDRLANTELAA